MEKTAFATRRFQKQNFFLQFISVRRNLIIEVISSLLVLLFIYAAVSKLNEYDSFKFQLGRSPYTTNNAGLIAWTLPVGEILVALSLVYNNTRLIGLYASFFLMLLFTGYIYAILHYSNYVPCSCGGILSQMDWNEHFVFNIIFTVLALIGLLFYKKL
jgi:hypothetical protein